MLGTATAHFVKDSVDEVAIMQRAVTVAGMVTTLNNHCFQQAFRLIANQASLSEAKQYLNAEKRNQLIFKNRTKAALQFNQLYVILNIKAMAKALSHWRFNTLVDKSALDKRQKMFLVNNAKMEVQRSKTTLA